MGVTFASWLLASMLAASGLFKARAGARLGIGVTPVTLLELAAAIGLAAVPLLLPSLPPWVAVAAVVLMIGSSVHHARRLGAIRRQREASEGGRLAAYVKYLSEAEPDD